MLNVHENSCKDQLSACVKYRPKVLDRISSLPSAVNKDHQTSPVINLSVKNVHSFKEKRSSSTPARIQPVNTAATNNLQRSSTSPTGQGGGYSSGQAQWRKVAKLLGIDRVISEETECDGMATTQDTSNSSGIPDTMSVSMESLDEGSGETIDFDIDPELVPLLPEAEAWSVTVDKKVLKRMSAKDIKRQDTIWELIQTEVHYCRALKILQKLYKRGMLTELRMPQEVVDRIFPRLDDLVDIHMSFLGQLQQLQAANREQSVEEIGPTLVAQFSGECGEWMKSLYGEFCSRHKDSVKIYKDLLKSDRKFQAFTKKCDMNSFVQKREIPGFILLISQRITKYPILIDNIIKSTKAKKDRESLSEALKLSKEFLADVDAQVDLHMKEQRLLEIYNRLDGRQTTLFRGNKFKKSDLLSSSRKLIYEGFICLKSARGKVIDVMAIILTDLILFIQESNQKYTFVTHDGKPAALSLYRLLVREKSDTRDNRGIYLISQNKAEAEMYELVCKSPEDRQHWIVVMRAAIERCPQQEEILNETEQEKKLQEAQAAKTIRIREIIELLHTKDQEIKACCDDKNKLFGQLLDVYNRELPNTRVQEDEPPEQEVGDVLLAAIEEASRLTVMLQASGGVGPCSLSRSVSSVGEHVSASYPLIPPVPKRAETFAGFDNHDKESQQKGLLKKRFMSSIGYGMVLPDNPEPTSFINIPDSHSNDILDSGRKGSSSPAIPRSLSPHRSQSHLSDHEDSETKLSDRSSDQGSSLDEQDSLGDLSMPFTSPINAVVQRDHVISFAQLGQYLHTIVHLTAQQGTAVERLRAQLHEANERINKLSADMNERNSASYRHNQLEELRNLQESINRERQEWEREREDERAKLDEEVISLREKQLAFERDQNELKARKEDLQRQREVFQKQLDLLRDNGILQNDNVSVPVTSRNSTNSWTDVHKGPRSPYQTPPVASQVIHKRSASAELPSKNVETSVPSAISPAIAKNEARNKPAYRYSFAGSSNPYITKTSSSSSYKPLPMHLLSCTNEQKAQVSSKLPQKGNNVQQVLPFKLASTSSLSSNSSLASAKLQPSASSLGLVKKLAEPTGRNRAASQPSLENLIPAKLHESHSTSKLDEDRKDKDNSVIYF